MSEYRLNKSGASALGCRPRAYNSNLCDGLCNGEDTQIGYLQTTVNVSIFLSKLLIHPDPHF
jgi:hypothetical protein